MTAWPAMAVRDRAVAGTVGGEGGGLLVASLSGASTTLGGRHQHAFAAHPPTPFKVKNAGWVGQQRTTQMQNRPKHDRILTCLRANANFSTRVGLGNGTLRLAEHIALGSCLAR
ncbi:hypothetical protein D9613_006163 [Agrocybe pediades]|uniref:Uncharacterized protein n=1 Tax=Agrocybe pediades TaxID=84607 RepID=A0A8H4VQ00_9AGAR|nr:hypothetical protein D9613_006163 [Agrocybe pediades]